MKMSKLKIGKNLIRDGLFRLRCNLCSKAFRATSRFLRFCKGCRVGDERLKFAEWMK